MPKSEPSLPLQRVVWKELPAGDLRKFAAQSNDADSGGGARDLRFRPYDQFSIAFAELFPRAIVERRKGGDLTVYHGRLAWVDAQGHFESADATFEPPTLARPNEGRLGRVHDYYPFQQAAKTPEPSLVLLIQDADGDVWPVIVPTHSLDLHADEWHAGVQAAIKSCLAGKRRQDRAAAGWVDFKAGTSYCNA